MTTKMSDYRTGTGTDRRRTVISVPLCFPGDITKCLSGSHTFLVVARRYVSQAKHAFLELLSLWCVNEVERVF